MVWLSVVRVGVLSKDEIWVLIRASECGVELCSRQRLQIT